MIKDPDYVLSGSIQLKTYQGSLELSFKVDRLRKPNFLTIGNLNYHII